MTASRSNLVLIGMPGVGKSTVGVLLAKASGRNFVDTDVLIQAGEGCSLQEMIDSLGREKFCQVEERYILCLDSQSCVIATGGSVVYSPAAMEHLKARGTIVYLDLPLADLEQRVLNLEFRGVVMHKGQSFAELYRERAPLYHQYADVTIQTAGLSQDQVVSAILAAV